MARPAAQGQRQLVDQLPPQSEARLLLAKKRSANATCPPRMAASQLPPKLEEAHVGNGTAKERLASMPRFRFSIPMVAKPPRQVLS